MHWARGRGEKREIRLLSVSEARRGAAQRYYQARAGAHRIIAVPVVTAAAALVPRHRNNIYDCDLPLLARQGEMTTLSVDTHGLGRVKCCSNTGSFLSYSRHSVIASSDLLRIMSKSAPALASYDSRDRCQFPTGVW